MALAAAPRRWRYPYSPLPHQAQAHSTWAKERLFGGAAGPGKTEWLIAEVLRQIFTYGVNGLILRRTRGALSQPQGIIRRLQTRIPSHVGRFNENRSEWTFANGRVLQLGYLAHDSDVQRYVGGEYGIIAWDQVEQFTEWQYLRMLHPLRVADPAKVAAGAEPMMIATANPGDVGHQWVKSRWIDPAPPGVVWQPSPSVDEPHPGTRCFISGRLSDNPYLGEDYRAQLEGLPEDLRSALLEGDWDVYAGARFGRLWRRHRHVIDPEDLPVPPGAGIVRACAVDYGSEAPFCALWGALFSDGLVVVYRELYARHLSPAEQAEAIREAEGPERALGRPLPTYLDPACWAKSPNAPRAGPVVVGGGKTIAVPTTAPAGSIADTYSAHGVPVMRATNDRLTGTALLARKLSLRPDGRPRLLIYSSCLNLIRTLPGIPRDKHNPELYATGGDDHACVAEGTPVLTVSGWRPIEAVGVGSWVRARGGWRRVLASGRTGTREMSLVVTADGSSLRVTGDHPVWVPGTGWVCVDHLTHSDTLLAWTPSSCPPPSRSSTGSGSTSAGPTSGGMVGSSTGSYGHGSTAQSPRESTFITGPGAATSTPSPTSPPRQRSITSATTDGSPPPPVWPVSSAAAPPWPPGTAASPLLNAPLPPARGGSPRPEPRSCVRCAGPSTRPPSPPGRGSVGGLVGLEPVELETVNPAGRGAVWNLTVAGEHEFVAAGLLVSNCDALRYLVVGLDPTDGGRLLAAPTADRPGEAPPTTTAGIRTRDW